MFQLVAETKIIVNLRILFKNALLTLYEISQVGQRKGLDWIDHSADVLNIVKCHSWTDTYQPHHCCLAWSGLLHATHVLGESEH